MARKRKYVFGMKCHLFHSELEHKELDKLGHGHLADAVEGEHHADGQPRLLLEPGVDDQQHVDVDQAEGRSDQDADADSKVKSVGGEGGGNEAGNEDRVAENCHKSFTFQFDQRSDKESSDAPCSKKN